MANHTTMTIHHPVGETIRVEAKLGEAAATLGEYFVLKIDESTHFMSRAQLEALAFSISHQVEELLHPVTEPEPNLCFNCRHPRDHHTMPNGHYCRGRAFKAFNDGDTIEACDCHGFTPATSSEDQAKR